MHPRIFLALLALTLAEGVLATEVDLNVNSDALRLTVDFPVTSNNLLLNASWLHHEDNGDAVSLGGHLIGSATSGAGPVMAGIGLRLTWIGYDKGSEEDGTTVGIGGFARYTLPDYDRVSLRGHAYYAPGVLSFKDAESFYDIEASVGYAVIRDADFYIGWRRMRVDWENDGDSTVDSGFHIGVRGRF